MNAPSLSERRPTISGAQVRAARALLGWSERDLARRAVISVATIERIEDGLPSTAGAHLIALQSTLEAAGIEFLTGDAPGVRLRSARLRHP